MAKKLSSIRVDENTVIVTAADVDETKQYSIQIKVTEKKEGPSTAGDVCIVRTGFAE